MSKNTVRLTLPRTGCLWVETFTDRGLIYLIVRTHYILVGNLLIDAHPRIVNDFSPTRDLYRNETAKPFGTAAKRDSPHRLPVLNDIR